MVITNVDGTAKRLAQVTAASARTFFCFDDFEARAAV